MMMDSEIREVLKETRRLAEENNNMLRKMRRTQIWERVTRIIYWCVVIIVALAGYYILQPFFEGVGEAYNTVRESVAEIKGVADSLPELPSFLGGGGETVEE
jgi:vancomycin permeability regulator SanA